MKQTIVIWPICILKYALALMLIHKYFTVDSSGWVLFWAIVLLIRWSLSFTNRSASRIVQQVKYVI